MVTLSDTAWANAGQSCKRQWLSCPLFVLLAPFPIIAPTMGLMTLENIPGNMELEGRLELSGHVRPGMRPSIWP